MQGYIQMACDAVMADTEEKQRTISTMARHMEDEMQIRHVEPKGRFRARFPIFSTSVSIFILYY